MSKGGNNLTTLSNDELIEKTSDWIMDHLGFCSCGQPDWFVYYLYVYLERVAYEDKPKDDWFQCDWHYQSDLIAYAYICDKEEWTDHGTSIIHTWLTDNGKELLKKLRRIDWSEYESC